MTWRAFIIGVLGVLGLALLTPVNDYAIGNTYLTGNHFPVGVFFFLLFLTCVANVAVKLLRASWALRRAELMLIFSMMLVSATVPASGLMRYLFPLTSSAPYLAQRADLYWEDDVLPMAPDGILLSTNPHSTAVRKFFEGTPPGEVTRVPWAQWAPVLVTWGIFVALYYLATFFLGGILRRQWVEYERLSFPVARLPLELTAGSGGPRLLPDLFYDRAFLIGAGVTLAFGLLRLTPLLAGGEQGWLLQIPVSEFIAQTPLREMPLRDGRIFLIAVGIAFLVASEISLSMWMFYILTCLEVQAFHWFGVAPPGGPWQFVVWQQAGAFVAFTVGILWMARRHLLAVARKALGGRGDDGDEPIGYRLSFWGLLACGAGMLAWYVHFGVGFWAGIMLLSLMLTIVIAHARLVTQGGLILVGQSWLPAEIMHGALGGGVFSGPAAVVVQAQHAVLFADAREMLSPHAMNSLRISSVFERHRRRFLPAMLVALAVALAAAGYSSLRWVYYERGALNLANTYAITWHSLRAYNGAHQIISSPSSWARPHYTALGLGAGLMFAFRALRGAFYWWPINPLGFLVSASWAIRPFWFSFLLGWAIKRLVLRFGTGGTFRKARSFFVGVIIAEATLVGLGTFFSLLTGIRIGYIFMPS